MREVVFEKMKKKVWVTYSPIDFSKDEISGIKRLQQSIQAHSGSGGRSIETTFVKMGWILSEKTEIFWKILKIIQKFKAQKSEVSWKNSLSQLSKPTFQF